MNSFTADWSSENNWLCPPVSLIGSTIRHLRICKGMGTLLVPMWESSYFWPLLYPNGVHMADFIKDTMVVNPYYESYIEDTVFKGYAPFSAVALKLQF